MFFISPISRTYYYFIAHIRISTNDDILGMKQVKKKFEISSLDMVQSNDLNSLKKIIKWH